jgi:two-component system, OmpR family, response regulator
MDTQDHILVVDDDTETRKLLEEYLSKNAFRVTAVGDGKTMREVLDQSRVDLIVLDLMLPGEDGLTLCRNVRAQSDTPIIMLTARGDQTDRIIGLEMGADDYLPKPFNPRELLARIKVVLRRTRSLPENLKPEKSQSIRFGDWRLDVVSRNLVSASGVVTPLSGGEYRLLRIFLDHSARVLTRDQLMDLMQGRENEPFARSIDVQVSRLRRRLGEDAKEPVIIKTVRSEGYVLTPAVEVDK